MTKRLTTSAQEAVVRRSVNEKAVHKLIVTGWRSSSEVAEQARLQRSSISGLMSEAGLSWKQASLVILFSQTLGRSENFNFKWNPCWAPDGCETHTRSMMSRCCIAR